MDCTFICIKYKSARVRSEYSLLSDPLISKTIYKFTPLKTANLANHRFLKERIPDEVMM